jgi:NADH-quinone oxidoreductase subunit C
MHARLLGEFGAETIQRFLETDLSDAKNVHVCDPPQVLVTPALIRDVARFCRDDDVLAFDSLMCLSALDRGDSLSVVYHLHSTAHRHKLALRVDVSRIEPVVPTVEDVWATAQWHEREAYDLMGIRFDGHSDLRRILLPDDWQGHPLRKDYRVQEFYRGMKVPY